MNQNARTNPYDPGHPWHYVLGGDPLSLKQIRQSVNESDYKGYLADTIEQAASRAEPARSTALRDLKATVLKEFKWNVSRYREVGLALHRFRKEQGSTNGQPECHDVHTSVSLKHNHLYNDFANLRTIEHYLNYQPDLFDTF
ncbi:MAG: hypothetical protein AAF632_20685 [Bacteroidota bacterium]